MCIVLEDVRRKNTCDIWPCPDSPVTLVMRGGGLCYLNSASMCTCIHVEHSVKCVIQYLHVCMYTVWGVTQCSIVTSVTQCYMSHVCMFGVHRYIAS